MSWLFSSGGQSISLPNEYSVLISFRIDSFDLLAVQGALKTLFQHHSLKASVLQCSAFLMVQFSHLYMTTGKNIAFTIWIFFINVLFLLFNRLSMFVILFFFQSFNFVAEVTVCRGFGAQANNIFTFPLFHFFFFPNR